MNVKIKHKTKGVLLSEHFLNAGGARYASLFGAN